MDAAERGEDASDRTCRTCSPDRIQAMTERLRIRLTGAVQGVGFRPFVFRLATSLGLRGRVENNSSGLHVEAEGDAGALREFLRSMELDHPPHARIFTWETTWLPPAGYADFRIEASESGGERTAAILPDLAPCAPCTHEFLDDTGRRRGYPFTNCTNCGPRYTIVRSLPYDRPNTTMAPFSLCPDCRGEYEDPHDRRFHAQPIACPRCGPGLSASIESIAGALRAGEIVALKGVGGYQLLADASNQDAVLRLRQRKRREWKPFAVMVSGVEMARAFAALSEDEVRLLACSAAPIVLLRRRAESGLAPSVCGASPWVGIMLPSSPLHVLLMHAVRIPLVCTSGNLSEEPIAIESEEAHARLAGVADRFLDHDRPIARPCDDSVARVMLGRTTVLRRARGYAPLPVALPFAAPPVLAVGGHLKSAVALAIGRQAIVSQHIGDLDSLETREAFERAIEDLSRLYEFHPVAVACDLHPDYYSTLWAEKSGLPLVRVQHHEAHALSCLAENDARGPALAVCWDGTGYGHDGMIWGSEFFFVDEARLERVAHLQPFPLAGGDRGAKECGRSAAGLLHRLGLPVEGPLGQVLARGTGCVETTSMGRLFDAIAWLTGLAWQNRFEGEAGLTLEAAAWSSQGEKPYPMGEDGDWRPLLEAVLEDLRGKTPAGAIAARFHLGLADWIACVAVRSGAGQVALSGGCFQNALLTEAAAARLSALGIRTLVHQVVPPNDGGIALGQVVAAARVLN